MAGADAFSPPVTPRKGRLHFAARQARLFFRAPRLLGLAATGLAAWLLVFVVLGRTDVSGLLPKAPRAFYWPSLPRFLVWNQRAPDGREETVYTVPSHQLTAREMTCMTNAVPAGAPKK